MEFPTIIDILLIFLLELEIYWHVRFKNLSLLTNYIFCKESNILWNKLPNQIKRQLCEKKIKIRLDDFRNDGKKKKLRGHFGELSDKLLNRILSVYRYRIDDVYVLCKNSVVFFFF